MPGLAAAVPAVTWLQPSGPKRLARHLAARGLVSLPSCLRVEAAAASASSSGKWGQGSHPYPRDFLFQGHAEPTLLWCFGTSCSFGLGFASPSFLQGWNLLLWSMLSFHLLREALPDHRPKQHPQKYTTLFSVLNVSPTGP